LIDSAAGEAVPDSTIDGTPPTEEEVARAVSHLKKAPGLCNLTAEILKNTRQDGIKWLRLDPFFSQSGNLEASQRTGAKELSCHSVMARAVNMTVVITEELLCCPFQVRPLRAQY